MEIQSDEFKGAVTVCNGERVIIDINHCANQQLLKNEGKDLLGSNLLDCCHEPARSKLELMLQIPTINTYTVEKDGIKRIIHQTPNSTDVVFSEVIELSIDIPKELPFFESEA